MAAGGPQMLPTSNVLCAVDTTLSLRTSGVASSRQVATVLVVGGRIAAAPSE